MHFFIQPTAFKFGGILNLNSGYVTCKSKFWKISAFHNETSTHLTTQPIAYNIGGVFSSSSLMPMLYRYAFFGIFSHSITQHIAYIFGGFFSSPLLSMQHRYLCIFRNFLIFNHATYCIHFWRVF